MRMDMEGKGRGGGQTHLQFGKLSQLSPAAPPIIAMPSPMLSKSGPFQSPTER
jgi:hypothetical protein